jgi:putative ABC transport system permease protein
VSVASAYGPPLGSGNVTGEVRVEGRPVPEPGTETYAPMHSITPAYFETMRLPLLRGRGIEKSDRAGTPAVAVVSETFARENFPGGDPLRKRFEVTADFGFGSPTWTIVGVAGDVRRGLTDAPRADVYVPLGQYGPGSLTVTLRTTGANPAMARSGTFCARSIPGCR